MKCFELIEYFNLLNDANLIKESNLYDSDKQLVQNLTYNSKMVTEGTLFVCKGVTFKEEYLMQSLEAGTFAYISEKKYELKGKVPYIIVSDVRKAMPLLGKFFYNDPGKKISITGITGTKGKSTTVYYLKAIMDDYFSSMDKLPSGVISSIDTYDGVSNVESQNTTPEAMEVYRHLSNAVSSGLSQMIMETSSQAFKYERVEGVRFNVGVMLNISEDHISPIEHPDFNDYFTSKLKIFSQSKIAVVNLDADFLQEILDASRPCEEVITFSTKNENADYYAYNIRKERNEIVFSVKSINFDEEFAITMPGFFNVENAVAAIAIADVYGIPVEYMRSGLYKARPKGRMQVYETKDRKIIVIVDFAHNKLSFDRLFESTRKEYPDYDISIVFGTTGGKAIQRREGLGKSAGEHADRIYLVPDDPGPEDPMEICKQIASYIEPYNKPVSMYEDREKGIKAAFEDVKNPTVILFTGKGTDAWQNIKGVHVPGPSDIDLAVKEIDAYNMKL